MGNNLSKLIICALATVALPITGSKNRIVLARIHRSSQIQTRVIYRNPVPAFVLEFSPIISTFRTSFNHSPRQHNKDIAKLGPVSWSLQFKRYANFTNLFLKDTRFFAFLYLYN